MLTLLSWTLGSMEEEAKQIRKLWQSHCFTFSLLIRTIREDNKRKRYISTGFISVVSLGELVRWSEQRLYADILTKCSTKVKHHKYYRHALGVTLAKGWEMGSGLSGMKTSLLVSMWGRQLPSSVKWWSCDFFGKGEHCSKSFIVCFSCNTSSLGNHTQHRAGQGRAGKYSCCIFLYIFIFFVFYNISKYQNKKKEEKKRKKWTHPNAFVSWFQYIWFH